MPQTAIVIYRESDGKVPLIEWFDSIPNKAQDKCIARIEILQEKGHELRRPICDYLDIQESCNYGKEEKNNQ